MVLSSDDSYFKYLPESDIIDLPKSANNLPGGLSIHQHQQHESNMKLDTKHPISDTHLRKRTHSESHEDTNNNVKTSSRDDDCEITAGFEPYMHTKRPRTDGPDSPLKAVERQQSRHRIFKGVTIYASRFNDHHLL